LRDLSVMTKEEIRSEGAPKAIGPYSQAVRAGGMLFLSGSIPVDPSTGELTGGSVGEQTRRVLTSLGNVLEEAGLDMRHVVKTTVFLKDLKGFKEMNEAYAEFFSEPYPARATVEVSGLPRGALVEIDAIAVTG